MEKAACSLTHNQKAMYSMGLDVGSTTAKIAVMDNEGKLVYSKYERHNARVSELVSRYFDEIQQLVGVDAGEPLRNGQRGHGYRRAARG